MSDISKQMYHEPGVQKKIKGNQKFVQSLVAQSPAGDLTIEEAIRDIEEVYGVNSQLAREVSSSFTSLDKVGKFRKRERTCTKTGRAASAYYINTEWTKAKKPFYVLERNNEWLNQALDSYNTSARQTGTKVKVLMDVTSE